MRKAAAICCTVLFVSLFGALPAHADTSLTTLAPSTSAGGFGSAVAVSSDKAIVGAPASGLVVFFGKTTSGWAQRASFKARDTEARDEFGTSVAMSHDTLIVGAPADTERGLGYAGSARIFTWSSNAWVEKAKLVPSDVEAKDLFGHAVAISGDIAIVGSPFDDDQGTNTGSAYVFTRSGDTWVQSVKLKPANGVSGFGSSIALSGTTAVIGAGQSAFVFTRTSNGWSQQAKLTPADGGTNDFFGLSVALEGDIALIGSPFHDSAGSDAGSAYVFGRTGTSWYQRARLNAADAARTDRFGWTVALSGDTAVVGSPYDDQQTGSTYVFKNTGSSWSEIKKIVAPTPATGERVGSSVAAGGGIALTSAPPVSEVYAYAIGAPGSAPPPSAPGLRTSLTRAGGTYLGRLGTAYDLTFDVLNATSQPVSTTLQLVESGSYGNGDASWGTKTVSKQIGSGQVGSFPFAGSHSWQWTRHDPSVRGATSDWLSGAAGCGDLGTVLGALGDVIMTADTPLVLAERAKQVFGLADPVHAYTYQRGSGTSPSVTFDPIHVKLTPSPLRIEALLHSLTLALQAKAWACAGWAPSGLSAGHRDAVLATSAAYQIYADRLYRAAWDQDGGYTVVPTPASLNLGLSGVSGAVKEHVDRLMSVAGLQDARMRAMLRAESATNAGQHVAATQQLEAALRWSEAIADAALGVEALTSSFTAALPQTMTRQQHLDFASSVRTNGLPGRLGSFLRSLGYSDGDVSELQRSWGIAPASPRDGALVQSITSGFAAQQIAEASLKDQLLRTIGESYGHLGLPDSALSLSGPNAMNGWHRTNPQATVTGVAPGGGTVSLEYRIGTGAWKAYTGAFQIASTADVWTRGKVGSLVQEPPRQWRARFDQTPPVTSVSGVSAGWVNAPVVADFTVGDTGSGSWTTTWTVQPIGGGPAVASGSGRFVSVLNEGQWRLNVSSKDVAGNQEQWRNVPVRIDRTPPQSDINEPLNKSFVGEVSLSGPSSDALSGVARVELVFQRLDALSGKPTGAAVVRSAPVAANAWDFRGAIDGGRYRVWPQAFDNAGNLELDPAADWIEIVVV